MYVDARGVTRKALLKGIGKGAIKAQMADGSEVYLSGNDHELKQLEAAAERAQEQEQARVRGVQGGTRAIQGPGTGAGAGAPPAYEEARVGAGAGQAGSTGTTGRYGGKVTGEKW